jgi:hypothetical protein
MPRAFVTHNASPARTWASESPAGILASGYTPLEPSVTLTK